MHRLDFFWQKDRAVEISERLKSAQYSLHCAVDSGSMLASFILILFIWKTFSTSEDRNPCRGQLQSRNYHHLIASEFPPLPNGQFSVISTGRHTNIFCVCESPSRMTCRIISTSEEMESILQNRIHPEIPANLAPFFNRIFGYTLPHSVLFIHTSSMDDSSMRVLCEVLVIPFRAREPIPGVPDEIRFNIRMPSMPSRSLPELTENERPNLRRTKSAPAQVSWPDTYIPLETCTGGDKEVSCPITLEPFEVGQLVYILKQEFEKVKDGRSVGCISSAGLIALKKREQSLGHMGFLDPLRRRRDRLSIKIDFDAYIVSDDPKRTSWVFQSITNLHTASSSASTLQHNFDNLSMHQSDNSQESEEDLPEQSISSTFTFVHFLFYIKFIFEVFLIFFIIITCNKPRCEEDVTHLLANDFHGK